MSLQRVLQSRGAIAYPRIVLRQRSLANPRLNTTEAGTGAWSKFWRWTTRQQPELQRWSAPWWREQALLCTVFAVAGSSSVTVARPAFKKVTGLEGTFRDGPWSYRIGSLIFISPVYTAILLTAGTLAGRHTFFAMIARRMWGRFLPKPLAQKVGCEPAKQKAAAAATAASARTAANAPAAAPPVPRGPGA